MDMFCASAEEHRGLPCAVASADDRGVGVAAEARFHVGRGVIDASAFIIFQSLQWQPLILDASGDQDGAGADRLAIVERDAECAIILLLQSGCPARHRETGAEFHRLYLTTPDKIAA